MLKQILLFTMVICAFSCSKTNSSTDLVNPIIGTGWHGHTYPGVSQPFALVQLSPDTRNSGWDACSGYHYSDSTIIGFSHTHLSGTGCADLADVLLRPTVQDLQLDTLKNYIVDDATFSHKNEKSSPFYYSVILDNENIKVELTSTKRVGIHRYTFPKSNNSKVILDLFHSISDEFVSDSYLKKISNTEIVGYRKTIGWSDNQQIYFIAKFSKNIKSFKLISDKQIIISEHVKGNNSQAVLGFETSENEQVIVKVALSTVSIDNAIKNLNIEALNESFDDLISKSKSSWKTILNKIKIKGGTKKQKEIFYTSLYRCFLAPNIINDNNGEYRGFNNKIYKSTSAMYSTFSIWDTFRAWHPLMTIIDKDKVKDFIKSFYNIYMQKGELPIWPLFSGETGTMIGYHSVSVIADAVMKGIEIDNIELILDAMIKSSNTDRKGKKYYTSMGYIPSNYKSESVSCLLEYAYDDWCIAQVAKKIGKTKIYEEYILRSQNFYNVYDGYTGFFRGKKLDGNWTENFNEYEVSRNFTEATPWQYRFFVPHDINALINLMGGKQKFEKALDKLFSAKGKLKGHLSDVTGLIGQYVHGNEPSHHMAYLYNYIGKPWKSQKRIREILEVMYDTTPEGICGNEDCGQMSAWYVLSSIGLYPVCPGSNQFILTSPIFSESVIDLGNGKKLKIIANNCSKENCYIKNVKLNGKIIDENFVTYTQIMNGGELVFELSNSINKKRRGVSNLPYSYSNKSLQVSSPYFEGSLSMFIDSQKIILGSRTSGANIYYTLDGSEPNKNSKKYIVPFVIHNSINIKAIGIKNNYSDSKIMQVYASKVNYLPALKFTPKKNGVKYRYYEGEFKSTKNIYKSKIIDKGFLNNFSLEPAKIEDYYAFIFDAYIYIPKKGIYNFYTTSDDGSCLYINGSEVVNNDGSHGEIRANGKIALQKGFHKIRVEYLENYEGNTLEVGFSCDSEKVQLVTDNMLFVN